MRRYRVLILMIILFHIPLLSQADLSGTAKITLGGNIPNRDNYNSLINPSNILGLNDINLSSSLLGKLHAGDDETNFSIWFSFKEYTLGYALLASAYGDPVQEAGVYEIIKSQGDRVLYLNLLRFSSTIYLSNNLFMEVGRQSMLTGYGWGWNPIDFANPLKNPLDPDVDFKGVDGLSIKQYFGNIATLKLYGVLPEDYLSSGLEYREIKYGGELTLNFTGFEAKFAGIYDYDEILGSDSYTSALGSGFILDLYGIGFYCEVALREGSRNYFIEDDKSLLRKKSWLYSILFGLEYTFVTDTYLIVEYFYNGEGYNSSDRVLFRDTISLLGSSSDLISLYSPGYFAKHYYMLSIMQPLYDIDSTINLSAIFSQDSGALTIIPSISYSFTGSYSLELLYIGMFDLNNREFSEVTEFPVKHRISAIFTYVF